MKLSFRDLAIAAFEGGKPLGGQIPVSYPILSSVCDDGLCLITACKRCNPTGVPSPYGKYLLPTERMNYLQKVKDETIIKCPSCFSPVAISGDALDSMQAVKKVTLPCKCTVKGKEVLARVNVKPTT